MYMSSSYQVARIVCQLENWNISQLKLHKALYFLNMVYRGNYGKSLITNEYFEAWDYGPVLPQLYNYLELFGARNIKPYKLDKEEFVLKDDQVKLFLQKNTNKLMKLEPYQLVKLLLDKSCSAWNKNYKSNRKMIIHNNDIDWEYNKRFELLIKEKEKNAMIKNLEDHVLINPEKKNIKKL